ncbi:hypothetical protein HLH36_16970 [Gluconacetobacter aggeris]|uniref:Uncharacterized protein n=1 Tax=Gluconacetobacter aggeris TaxID=1286186 RepID=A0A7W4IW66_9PROT|nr:hypothetical protein [Gluconacetobacter aggeris]MBB2170018.1 hypothetical protein [Gluconacetobacter aggeris]
MSIQSAVQAALTYNRRIARAIPSDRLQTPAEEGVMETTIRRWGHAWDAAWSGPARSQRDLIARATLAVSDPGSMDAANRERLARDVLAVLGGGRIGR